jgi:hypothetical protein
MPKRVLLFFMVLVMPGLSLAWAGQSETRWVTGDRVATDTRAQPNTFVVSAMNWKGQGTIVGATVDEDTVIKIGKRGGGPGGN